MTWGEFLLVIEQELGSDIAQKIEHIGRTKFGGCRITILKNQKIDSQKVEAVAPGQPRVAAKKLGVSISTVYRAINNGRIIR